MDSDGEIDYEPVTTKDEASDILHQTIFEFAQAVLNLCLQDEKSHPKKYEGKMKPSTKIRVVTVLLQCWDKNRNRLSEHYVNYVLGHKQKIDARDDNFFLHNDHIFPGAGKEDIEFFRDLWRPGSTFHLSKVEKESVYEYFDIMMHYCQRWKEITGYVAAWEKGVGPYVPEND